jgi:hypothetical protein
VTGSPLTTSSATPSALKAADRATIAAMTVAAGAMPVLMEAK